MINHKTMTFCLELRECTKVLELKKIVGGIVKTDIEDIKLFKDNQVNCADSNNGYTVTLIILIHI